MFSILEPKAMKKVQFEAATHDATTSDKPPPAPSPTRMVVGKAHPVRDLIAFLSIFVLALFATSGLSFGGDKTKEKIKHTNVKKKNLLESAIQTIMETRYREKACDIFLHSGKIPRSGFSLFAGKEYGMNEVLFDDLSDPFLAILVKPHPTLANVKFVLHEGPRYSLETTQTVASGEEFFLSFQDSMVINHPEYYTTIPTPSDYQAAYEIAQNLPYTNPASQKWKRRHQQPASFGTIHKHVRDAVAKVNPVVSNLLFLAPGDPERNVSEMFLRRPSVTRAGTCVERLHQNSYQTGELVAQIPLELSKGFCGSVAYGDYCGIVSSIVVGDSETANVKIEWKADGDNHRPVLYATAIRPIAPNTAMVAEPTKGKAIEGAAKNEEL